MAAQAILGKRIALFFSTVVLILVALGGVGAYEMLKAKTESAMLATEFLPKVELANEIRSAANRTIYEIRGYALTEDPVYFEDANKELSALKMRLREASRLASKATHLEEARSQIQNATIAVDEYEKLTAQTEKAVADMKARRRKLDENAISFMAACSDFLSGRNEAFKKDLADRLEKIGMVAALVDLGAEVRTTAFKALAASDFATVEKAVERLSTEVSRADELRSATERHADDDRIDQIEASAVAYVQATQTCLNEARRNETSFFANAVVDCKGMDDAAENYLANGKALLEAQQGRLAEEISEWNRKIALAGDIVDIGNESRIKVFKAQALRLPELLKEALQHFSELDEKFAELRKIARLEEDIRRIDQTKASGADYAEALTVFEGEWRKLVELDKLRENAGNELIESCKAIADSSASNTGRIVADSMAGLSKGATIMIWGLSLGTLFAILAALRITRSITGPLNGIIESLYSSSGQFLSASEQVSSSSQQMAEGASEQAATIEQTSSALEEMFSSTKQNAENADQADNLMKEAGVMIDSANESMNKMIGSMKEINKASEETSKIIKTIDEIAFQTNLLALNAAVEAARAGQAGAGFAVVAGEVRNLAMQTADAAKSTSKLIEGTIKKVKEGTILVDNANEKFGEVARKATKAVELVGKIAAASKQQVHGIGEINTAVSEMDKVTQQNAANSEESASVAEELNAQAEQMNSSVMELVSMAGGNGIGKGGLSGRERETFREKPDRGKRILDPVFKRETSASRKKSDKFSADQVVPLENKDVFSKGF